MKSSFKFVGLFFVLVCFVSNVFAQKQIDNYYQFSPKEMESMMASFGKDAGWKNLSATMSSRSFGSRTVCVFRDASKKPKIWSTNCVHCFAVLSITLVHDFVITNS